MGKLIELDKEKLIELRKRLFPQVTSKGIPSESNISIGKSKEKMCKLLKINKWTYTAYESGQIKKVPPKVIKKLQKLGME